MLKQVLLVLALSIYQLNAEEGAARLLLAKQVNITMRTILKQFGFKPRLGWPLNYGCIEFTMGIRISISKNKHPFILIENGSLIIEMIRSKYNIGILCLRCWKVGFIPKERFLDPSPPPPPSYQFCIWV